MFQLFCCRAQPRDNGVARCLHNRIDSGKHGNRQCSDGVVLDVEYREGNGKKASILVALVSDVSAYGSK